MVGLIATTLLAGARMPAGATSNMKRKIPRDAADRIAVAGPERDVRNLVPFLRMEKCFFLTSPFIEPRFFAAKPPKSFVGSLPPAPSPSGPCFARVQGSQQAICNALCNASRITKGGETLGTLESTVEATKKYNPSGAPEEEVRRNLDRYAEFIDANVCYVVSEAL